MHTLGELVGMPNEALARVDPLEMNLLVAKVLPRFRNLDIPRYANLVDEWASDFLNQLGECEYKYRFTPEDWGNDIRLFRSAFSAGTSPTRSASATKTTSAISMPFNTPTLPTFS